MTYIALSREAATLWCGIDSDLSAVRRVAGSSFTTPAALKSAREAVKRAKLGLVELEKAMRA